MLVTCRPLLMAERQGILTFLCDCYWYRTLSCGAMTNAAIKFGRTKFTISHFWAHWKSTMKVEHHYRNDMRFKQSRAKRYNRKMIQDLLRTLRVTHCSSIQAVAAHLKIGKSTGHCMVQKEKIIKTHSSSVKSSLTTSNKFKRLKVSWMRKIF